MAQQGVETDDVKAEIGTLVPFLTAPKSTTRFESVEQAWGSVWDAMQASAPPRALLPRLLDMAAPLLHPPITTDPPRAASVLDDLYRLFSHPKAGAPAKKIAFYLAAMRQVSRTEWLALEREVRKDADKLREESADEAAAQPTVGASLKLDEPPAGPLPPASITLL